MRYIYILIALGLNYSILSQTLQFFNLGQTISTNEHSCLVIKNNLKALKKISTYISKYDKVSALKLVDFNDGNGSLDSVLQYVKPMKGLKQLIFENCDLSTLETSFADFKSLEEVSILKESSVFENAFFPLLKHNAVKSIYIQTNDSEIITDSLCLLPDLKSVHINSGNLFTKANYTQTLQIKTKNAIQDIEIAYFGDFYKPNASGVVTVKHKEPKEKNTYTTTYDCIKQPIPGIKINDTTYTFNPQQKVNFTYKSGTTLSVDRNAFLTGEGKSYNGPVTLFYREFRTPVEIMLSGIPMTNKVDGKEELFKSGGMYEINAYDQNKAPLTLLNDTAIKIKFALTDTSKNFQFFSLNTNGSWATVSNSITTVNSLSGKASLETKAVKEYYKFLNNVPKNIKDTTVYEERFAKDDYIYTYRKDNFLTLDTSTRKGRAEYKKDLKRNAMFCVKFLKETKDGRIIFTITKAPKNDFPPLYILAMLHKNYLYEGNLTKEEFKKLYNRKVLYYDVRTTASSDNAINIDFKTVGGHTALAAQIVYLKDDGTYIVQKKAAKYLNQRIARCIKKDARDYNKIIHTASRNSLNYYLQTYKKELAFKHSQKFQNDKEQNMSFGRWQEYVSIFSRDFRGFSQDNELGQALLKSGLGFKNIDCYIHSGQMQDIFVQYKGISPNDIGQEFHAVLYKTINTSYPLNNYSNNGKLAGYYFKEQPNYILRFSIDGTMQVTKPEMLSGIKRSSLIDLDYIKQYNVKGMDSDDITKLIMD